jgi:hypothetical protein
MSRKTEASNRALHHEQKRKLKDRRRIIEQERRDAFAEQQARGLRSHLAYAYEEGFMPAGEYARICQEARRRRG